MRKDIADDADRNEEVLRAANIALLALQETAEPLGYFVTTTTYANLGTGSEPRASFGIRRFDQQPEMGESFSTEQEAGAHLSNIVMAWPQYRLELEDAPEEAAKGRITVTVGGRSFLNCPGRSGLLMTAKRHGD